MTDPSPPPPAVRLAAVRARIAEAARAAGRAPETVTLIAVSKTFGPEAIVPVIAAGQRVFGENRVQEAQGKWPALKAAHPDLQLHLIGPLQTNKVREAVGLFDAIHALDRPKLAAALGEAMARSGRRLALFVQVNTGAEPQKSGVLPAAVPDFVHQCRAEFGLTVSGLMCLPPVDADPVPHFALLARLAAETGLAQLSMGMSGDYPAAIAAGATHVRVGTAIFGGRH